MPATLKSIAARVGVSVRTVGRALNGGGYVKEELRAEIARTAEEMGYRPNRLAQGLRQQRSDEVVVLMNSVDELHISKVAGLERGLRDAGYVTSLVMLLGDAPGASIADLLGDIQARRPAAIAWFSGGAEYNERIYDVVRRNELPYVVFGLGTPSPAGLDAVAIDRQQGVYESVMYLSRRGRERIAYLACGEVSASQNHTRLEGYQRAMAEVGGEPQYIETTAGLSQFDQGREAGQRIVEAAIMPNAVQAFSDEVALGFLYGLHERGVRIPLDIAVVGFDNRSASQLSWPRLTTVAQPNDELGAAAAAILLEKLSGAASPAGGWSRCLPTHLVVRETA